MPENGSLITRRRENCSLMHSRFRAYRRDDFSLPRSSGRTYLKERERDKNISTTLMCGPWKPIKGKTRPRHMHEHNSGFKPHKPDAITCTSVPHCDHIQRLSVVSFPNNSLLLLMIALYDYCCFYIRQTDLYQVVEQQKDLLCISSLRSG